jgi:hypothetical protein
MIRVKSTKAISNPITAQDFDDTYSNTLWLDINGFIKYLNFQLDELKRVPAGKRTDEGKYLMKFLRIEIKYLNDLIDGKIQPNKKVKY